MHRYLAFLVDRPLGDNGFAGTVCGDAIKKGERFTMLYHSKTRMTPEEAWGELTEDHRIELTARRIEFWRLENEVDQIDRGHECLIEFDGDISGIVAGQIIGDEFTLKMHDEELERSRATQEQESEQDVGLDAG